MPHGDASGEASWTRKHPMSPAALSAPYKFRFLTIKLAVNPTSNVFGFLVRSLGYMKNKVGLIVFYASEITVIESIMGAYDSFILGRKSFV